MKLEEVNSIDPYLKYLMYVGVIILMAILVAYLTYVGLPINIPSPPTP